MTISLLSHACNAIPLPLLQNHAWFSSIFPPFFGQCLDKARAALEPVKAKFPDLSYADLYTYAGVVAVEESGGPKIPFSTGREDFLDGSKSDPTDRLPYADRGSRKADVQHMRDIFHRMGFDDNELVALMGAHAMGRCHTNCSGYWGPWTHAETTFSNEYFRLLVEER
jgi:cytochrome c peroxidase